MAGSPQETPFYESFGFKTLVAVVIILIFLAIFLIDRRAKRPSGASGAEQRPIEEIRPETPEPSGFEAAEPSLPQSSLESLPDHGGGASPIFRQANTLPLPKELAPDNTKTQADIPLSPRTQVHPLSEAGSVMGQSMGEGIEIGVTRTYQLPPQTQGNRNPTPPVDPKGP